jgi:hypothetical protein
MQFNSRLKQFGDPGSRVRMALRTWLYTSLLSYWSLAIRCNMYAGIAGPCETSYIPVRVFSVVLCRYINAFGRSSIQGVLQCVTYI